MLFEKLLSPACLSQHKRSQSARSGTHASQSPYLARSLLSTLHLFRSLLSRSLDVRAADERLQAAAASASSALHGNARRAMPERPSSPPLCRPGTDPPSSPPLPPPSAASGCHLSPLALLPLLPLHCYCCRPPDASAASSASPSSSHRSICSSPPSSCSTSLMTTEAAPPSPPPRATRRASRAPGSPSPSSAI